ncbi:MAG: DUF1127 domain-containing protein [Reinekea sp.]|jgi:uncharacterized protein YjiS (DUF1127 family)|nr:DUF1127 domain-containing protein [Reinekea sp.]MDX1472968.1 DUF1127 domain-containing protein [Reinekea sp.]
MTTQQYIRNFKPNSHGLKAFFAKLKHNLYCRPRICLKDRAEYKKLAALPDYLLRDVGIRRGEINVKLNKPFWWS